MLRYDIFILIIPLLLGCAFGYLIGKTVATNTIKQIKKNTLAASKHVMTGQISEQIAPLLPGFSYNLKDMLFIGKGVDYVVFNGLTSGSVKEVVLIEVKTGKSQLSARERQIKNAINAGKVRYETIRINKN